MAKQLSMSKKHAFRRAQSMANAEGRAVAVIYDTVNKTYAAESLYGPGLSALDEELYYKIINICKPATIGHH